jgi:uncharacterized protein (DUF1800 family)
MNPTAISSDRRIQAAHLLRRAGFGGTPAEIEELAGMSHNDAVEKLLTFKYDGDLAFNLQRKFDEAGYTPGLNDMQYWWLLTMVRTKQPLQERMTLFWHGHFTTAYSKVKHEMLLMQQNQLYRDYALGNFKELVKAVSRNPAMIEYLDGQSNRKGKPNENYARELMELFTIGIGNYTEQDVREAARAFTGWSYRGQAYFFQKNQHDDGSKTFMGKTGNFNGDDIIDIIIDNRQTGRFITTKLWRYFVYDNPEPEVIDRLTDVFYKSNYSIKDVLRAIFTSPEFLSPKAYRALVKSPTDLVVSALRQLGTTGLDNNIGRAVSGMGQVLFSPPTVKGWDGSLSWINSSLFFERANGLDGLALARNVNDRFDPYRLLTAAKVDSLDGVVDHFLNRLLDGDSEPEVRNALADYLKADGKVSFDDLKAAGDGKTAANAKLADTKVRGLVHLILSTPEYQLK